MSEWVNKWMISNTACVWISCWLGESLASWMITYTPGIAWVDTDIAFGWIVLANSLLLASKNGQTGSQTVESGSTDERGWRWRIIGFTRTGELWNIDLISTFFLYFFQAVTPDVFHGNMTPWRSGLTFLHPPQTDFDQWLHWAFPHSLWCWFGPAEQNNTWKQTELALRSKVYQLYCFSVVLVSSCR